MFEAFTRADQRRWGQAYVRGLLLDGRRKSVEPMAARLGEDGNRQARPRPARAQAHVLAVRRPADPPRRPRDPRCHRGR
ncbi:transposase [Streptomyces sp. NPDC001728]|uniref:transposase n=1 Tax=Streptomyces sp. NPDC001728 TaxID=3154396 RepID=UPI0033295627